MAKRPVEIDDLLRFRLVGDTQVSPDGARIAFTVKSVDTEKNKYGAAIWMADVAGASARQFTADGHSDGEPRWSPDGSQLALVSDRVEPGSQIYLIPADGGEARPLTKLADGAVTGIRWSPDGALIAFLFRATPPERTKKAAEERKEKGASSPARVHTRLFYRLDGFGYYDASFWQLRVADVATGEAKALTDEPFDHGSFTWSPDGRTIAFVANRRDDCDLSTNFQYIWKIPAEGGEITPVTAPDGPKEALIWSPDGQWLAYAGHTDPEDTWGGRNERVLVIPADGGEARDLTGASDKAVGYLTLSDMHESGSGDLVQWAPDSRSLFCPISAHGDTVLYTVNLDGTGLTPLSPADHEMGSFSMSADGATFGLLIGSADEPHQVFAGRLDRLGMDMSRVSAVGADHLAEVDLQMPEAWELPNDDGGTVQGWTLLPAGFDAASRYPCVLYVHGGPALQYGGQASPFHELQWLAAQGYVVVFSNPRGSKGYGEQHTSCIRGDWGNKDWTDVMAVADHAAAMPFVDADRMAIMGGSYGGFMAAWAVGHTSRFCCAIADRLVGNMQSMSGTCDFPCEPGKEFPGSAWEDPAELWRCSPMAYAAKIETPLLLIHSDGDLRCPIEQAEQLFAALRWQRKPVQFVRYPAETSHGLSRNGPPDLRLDRLRRNLAWLDKHLKDAA